MEPLKEPAMSFNELGELNRMERKSKMLTPVSGDLYQNIAELLRYLKKRYEQQISVDDESPKADRMNQERIEGTKRAKEIVDERMRKICNLALLNTMGPNRPIDNMTREEKEYYESILKHSVNHRKIIDRLSGNIRYRNADISPDPAEEENLAPPFHVPEVADAPAEPVRPEPAFERPGAVDAIPDDWGESNDDVPLDPLKEQFMSLPKEEPRTEEPFVPPIDSVPSDDDEGYDGDMPEDELDRMMADGMPVRAVTEKKPAPPQDEPADGEILLRILQDVPMPIAGPDGRQYILRKEDVVRMPDMLARMLVGNKMAVELHPSP